MQQDEDVVEAAKREHQQMVEAELLTVFVKYPDVFSQWRGRLQRSLHEDVRKKQRTSDLFTQYPRMFLWLFEFYEEYGRPPTRADAQSDMVEINEFTFYEPDESHSVEWLVGELEQHCLARQRKVIADEAVKDHPNPREAMHDLANLVRDTPYMYDVGNAVELVDEMEIDTRRSVTMPERVPGIMTGFSLLDEVTGGTQPSSLEVYFARPGQGKTFVLIYGAYCAMMQQRKRILFFSTEMTRQEIRQRLLTLRTNVDNQRLFTGQLSEDEFVTLRRQWEEWREQKRAGLFPGFLFYGKERRFSTTEVEAAIREHRPDLVCIDGILLLDPPPSDRRRDTLRDRVTDVCADLRRIGLELQVSIRVAHQANREVEKYKRKDSTPTDLLPTLSMLAESGSVEQYATLVVALHHDAASSLVYLAVRKNRNGPGGRIFYVKWDINHGRITNDTVEQEGARTNATNQPSFSDSLQLFP